MRILSSDGVDEHGSLQRWRWIRDYAGGGFCIFLFYAGGGGFCIFLFYAGGGGFCIFLSDPGLGPESKICEKLDSDPEQLFIFDNNRSLRGRSLSRNIGKFELDRRQPESYQESDSQI